MNRKTKIIILLIVIILVCIMCFVLISNNKKEIRTIKSDKQLSRIFNGDIKTAKNTFINIATMPFSFFTNNFFSYKVIEESTLDISGESSTNNGLISSIENATSSSNELSSSKDYSTTKCR